jgi:hypothetical protein
MTTGRYKSLPLSEKEKALNLKPYAEVAKMYGKLLLISFCV